MERIKTSEDQPEEEKEKLLQLPIPQMLKDGSVTLDMNSNDEEDRQVLAALVKKLFAMSVEFISSVTKNLT